MYIQTLSKGKGNVIRMVIGGRQRSLMNVIGFHMYKIRDITTGLYSKGGTSVRWGKKGKIWTEKGHLSNHLAQFRDPNKTYEGCEIVELALVTRSEISIADWTAGVLERRRERNKSRQQRYEEHQKKQRRIQYEALRREFER